MVYYNADGNESTMCGNGYRCIVSFAHFLNIFENKTSFMAIDGLHEAEVNGDLVKLKMIDVEDINTFPEYTVMNTGSPSLCSICGTCRRHGCLFRRKK